jgi:hypothetical protein
VEFGVQSYRESNTRFLVMHDNWRGLVMECTLADVEFIKNDYFYWMYDLLAVQARVTPENINELLQQNGFDRDLGIFSIDIDSNDYWVWKAMDVVKPVIVIAEYNSAFGAEHAITIPYQENFDRTRAHTSNLFWGCSLKALCHVAEQKGYALVGCNRQGLNAYFVRKDRLGSLKAVSDEAGYVQSKFKGAQTVDGKFSYIAIADRLKTIADLTVYDVLNKQSVKIKDLQSHSK